jgi:anti-sigma factor ChrR (cupin superfamily)
MVKTSKIISIDLDMFDDIKKRRDKFGFNFSEWVVNKYRSEFQSVSEKEAEIMIKEKEIKNLKNEISMINLRNDEIQNELTQSEKRFLSTVKTWISEGKEWQPLCNRFNNEYKKRYSLHKFKQLVKLMGEKNES